MSFALARTGTQRAQAMGCGPGTVRYLPRVAFQQTNICAIPGDCASKRRDAGL